MFAVCNVRRQSDCRNTVNRCGVELVLRWSGWPSLYWRLKFSTTRLVRRAAWHIRFRIGPAAQSIDLRCEERAKSNNGEEANRHNKKDSEERRDRPVD
jgi:hypothetical protein